MQLLGGGTAEELIPELVRQGLHALIEAEAAAAPGADRHQCTEQALGIATATPGWLLPTPSGDIQLRIPYFSAGSFFPLPAPAPRWSARALAVITGISKTTLHLWLQTFFVQLNRRSSTAALKPYGNTLSTDPVLGKRSGSSSVSTSHDKELLLCDRSRRLCTSNWTCT